MYPKVLLHRQIQFYLNSFHYEKVRDGKTWYTLAKDEWDYLFNVRDVYGECPYGENMRSGKYKLSITVFDKKNCAVLLPDNWVWDKNTVGEGWQSEYNEETAVKWSTMEAAGAVCLPATGYRGTWNTGYIGELGWYWSSTNCGSAGWYDFLAYILYFTNDYCNPIDREYTECGESVRLVKNVIDYPADGSN